MLDVFIKVCEKWLHDNYNNDYVFTFRSKSVVMGNMFVSYILIHHITDECCPIYDVQFISDGRIKIRRMYEDFEHYSDFDFECWKNYNL